MPEGPKIPRPPASAPQPLSQDAPPDPTQAGGLPVLRLLESFVDVLPCGAALVSGNMVRLNRPAEVMLGCAPGQLRTLDEWFAHVYGSDGSDGSQHRRRYEQAETRSLGGNPCRSWCPGGAAGRGNSSSPSFASTACATCGCCTIRRPGETPSSGRCSAMRTCAPSSKPPRTPS